MAFLDQLKNRAQDLGDQLKTRKDQYRSREFADASMAVCALVAAADGSIDPSERQRTAGLIAGNDVLAVFPPEQLRGTFDGYCDKLVRDFELGKVDAITAIGALRDKPEQARAVVAIALVIGNADGSLDDSEGTVIRDACHAVGIAPSEFDL